MTRIYSFFVVILFWTRSMAERESEKVKRIIYSNEPENNTAIIARILSGYDKSTRPYYRVKPLVISVDIMIVSVSHISEEDMEFQSTMYMRQFWHDPRLAYGINNTALLLQGENVDKIWTSDVYIDNTRKTTVDKNTKSAVIFASGSVYYSKRLTISALADMNFLNYPMDEQKLYLNIYSYMHGVEKIILKWNGGNILHKRLATYTMENITLLTKTEIYLTGNFTCLTFQFDIRRRLGYFLLQFYFPCVLSVLVSWLPFWMDRYEIGDRVALGITTLLTEVFLSQYINNAMPKVSYIKAADEFLLASFVFIFVALIESVVVYNARQDVREKKRIERLRSRHKPENNAPPTDDIPFSIVDVFKTRFHPKLPAIVGPIKDLGLKVDKWSRIIFPTSYIMFVVYYFGRYVLFNKLV